MTMNERTARVAAPVALALFVALGLLMTERPTGAAVAAAAVAVAAGAVLSWRRVTDWPLVAGLAVPAAALVFLGNQQSANLAWMGLCVLAGWAALPSVAPAALTAGAALAAMPVAQAVAQPSEPGWAAWFVGTAISCLSCVFARRLRLTVEQLRAAQGELAERSRAEERDRIAGEVHDVIGHALTVSLLHIGSARLALDDEPDEARAALEEAERLTRSSLEEVRATVGLMRTDAPGETRPLPGATDIPDLVDSFRRAGASIDLRVDGDLATLGSSRGLTAYRVVQEALTNATRHAPGRPITVALAVDDQEVTVSVTNPGTYVAATPPGAGLRGMRDRVVGVGGRLVAGPSADGWAVEAVLPS